MGSKGKVATQLVERRAAEIVRRSQGSIEAQRAKLVIDQARAEAQVKAERDKLMRHHGMIDAVHHEVAEHCKRAYEAASRKLATTIATLDADLREGAESVAGFFGEAPTLTLPDESESGLTLLSELADIAERASQRAADAQAAEQTALARATIATETLRTELRGTLSGQATVLVPRLVAEVTLLRYIVGIQACQGKDEAFANAWREQWGALITAAVNDLTQRQALQAIPAGGISMKVEPHFLDAFTTAAMTLSNLVDQQLVEEPSQASEPVSTVAHAEQEEALAVEAAPVEQVDTAPKKRSKRAAQQPVQG